MPGVGDSVLDGPRVSNAVSDGSRGSDDLAGELALKVLQFHAPV